MYESQNADEKSGWYQMSKPVEYQIREQYTLGKITVIEFCRVTCYIYEVILRETVDGKDTWDTLTHTTRHWLINNGLKVLMNMNVQPRGQPHFLQPQLVMNGMSSL